MVDREQERLQVVNRFLNLEISKNKELQEIVSLAAEICGTSMASITILDKDSQFLLFKIGLSADQTSRNDAFCHHAIDDYQLMVVPDALADERFENNPLVKGEPNIRFYAGSPLTTQDGYNLGTLCVLHDQPAILSLKQQKMLQILSRQVIQLLEFDASLNILREQFLLAKGAEIKMRSFFESAASSYLLIDKDYIIIAFNKAVNEVAENIYGLKLAVGMNIMQIVHQDLTDDFILNYNKALSGESIRHERWINLENQSHFYDITYDPARNDEGEIIGVSLNTVDITERNRNQQASLKTKSLLNKIAFIQSHELRKPVANIKGLLLLLEMEGHHETIPELVQIRVATEKLDETIALVVNYTAKAIGKIPL